MKPVLIVLLTLAYTNLIFSQVSDSLKTPRLNLELQVINLPYHFDAARTTGNGTIGVGSFFKGFANPGMQQSLSLTSSIYTAAHFGVDQVPGKNSLAATKTGKLLHMAALIFSDFILTYAPGGAGWLHEEYHRAVMTRFHVNSFNDMNTFPLGAELVSVNHVKDEDLIRFKLESHADFNRMHVAGIEGEYMLINKLQRNNFFYNGKQTHEILYWLSTVNSIAYVNASSNPESVDAGTDEMNLKEKSVPERDFTGYDFSGWAYDLFNPDEPYEMRGIHPTGTGIDRYIKTTDLSKPALDYLKKQGRLQWLNLLSPMLFWQKSISVNNDFRFNFAIRNFLTSAGNDISMNVFLKKGKMNLVIAYHHFMNYQHAFPALELECFEYPCKISSGVFLFSPRIIAGIQPENQSFLTGEYEFSGLAGFRSDWLCKSPVKPYLEITAKTNGWVAGNVFLKKDVSCMIGVSARFE